MSAERGGTRAPRKHHGRSYVVRRVVASWMNARRKAPPTAGSPARADTVALRAGLGDGAVVDAEPGEHVHLTPPRDAAARFARIPAWYRSDWWKLDHELDPQQVLRVPHGVLFGYEGWTGPDRHRVVPEWNAYARTDYERTRAVDEAVRRGVVAIPGTTASLLQLAQENYFHWMLQVLPRLFAILDTVGVEVDRYLVGTDRAFAAETLDRLGIEPARRQLVRPDAPVYECAVLVTTSWPVFVAPTPGWAIRRLREMFPAPPRRSGPARVYVSRADATRRRVVNDGEVCSVLERLGFVSMTMDGMTVAEQAALFAGADVVVGAHGAALANAAFLRAGTRLVELLPANNPRPHFWHVAAQVGAVYDVVIGSEPALRRRHDMWMNDADLVVDVRELERIVEG